MSPVEMAFDESGKVYVAEMFDYPTDPPEGKPRARASAFSKTQRRRQDVEEHRVRRECFA